ncbi:cupin-like domain-containing protein [Sphingomonas morindae]|uniref:Cupin-like domain-containing protein n=1 Tax=Sphingomonas morindae TaxID=1541170 RepID=A0ABY4XDI4_9SPHN|nr:cupin-like domain-containing protein [Sphingomonas morindae]USI74751.1 cupin-like domain-containing protein [Sphingomonas morindae]
MAALIEARDGAGLDAAGFDAIAAACRPVVLRGLVRHWPLVAAAETPHGLAAYVDRYDSGGMVEAFVGDPAIAGRYFYGDTLDGFNFERQRMTLREAVAALAAPRTPGVPSLYIGSLPIDAYLPGLAEQVRVPPRPGLTGGRLWIGHESLVSTHHDMLDNLACVVAGRRRFTLYPPELIGDLYVGPLDRTMAGQPVSLAASAPPGDPRYPRFAAVADQALVAELEPGDALYMPKLWWHQVEGLAPFNALLNFWWDGFAAGGDPPFASVLLAMISIAERPPGERAAWRALFDHYVFRPDRHPLEHLPAADHGVLGPLRQTYGRLRAQVMRMLRG